MVRFPVANFLATLESQVPKTMGTRLSRKVEDVKTKLSCETFLQDLKVEDAKTKLSCETFFQNLKVEDAKTKLSCEISLKI